MRQTYYGVRTETLTKLEELLSAFSNVTRQLFDRSLAASRREELQQERERLNVRIGDTLSGEGLLLGFLSEDQAAELDQVIAGLADAEVKRLLGSNIIPRNSLFHVIEALMLATNTPENLLFFLEKAQQNNQHIIVWIL